MSAPSQLSLATILFVQYHAAASAMDPIDGQHPHQQSFASHPTVI
jgi:hypothetical protein